MSAQFRKRHPQYDRGVFMRKLVMGIDFLSEISHEFG